MTKTWDTKNKIIDLLSKKKMTLTDLSKELDLAPSTVNQHIKELLWSNAIRQIDNPYYVKLKYYEVDPQFSGLAAQREPVKRVQPNLVWKIVPVVVAIAIVAGLLLTLGSSTITGQALSGPKVPTTFSVSDAPGSAAVSALNITVSSAMIESTSGKWSTIISTPETFDLVALDNISQFLGSTNLSAGTYDKIVLDVSNATAVVNNQSTGVFIPTNTLTIVGRFVIGSNSTNSSWINIDFDLAKSIHVTSNGEVVLLPFVTVSARDNALLGMNSNGIIAIRNPGGMPRMLNESMNLNGSFSSNIPPLPSGAQIEILTTGGAVILPYGNSTNTIVIRTRGSVIVIRNVTNASSLITNLSTQGGFGGQGFGVPTAIRCSFVNGSAECNMNASLSGNFLPPRIPIIPCRFEMCPRAGGHACPGICQPIGIGPGGIGIGSRGNVASNSTSNSTSNWTSGAYPQNAIWNSTLSENGSYGQQNGTYPNTTGYGSFGVGIGGAIGRIFGLGHR